MLYDDGDELGQVAELTVDSRAVSRLSSLESYEHAVVSYALTSSPTSEEE